MIAQQHTHTYVPWYNSSEWKNVYHQLFGIDSTRESMRDALNTLNVWKIRMPRLSSAIEGTLIVLKGFLEITDELPEDLRRQLLASSVMRFLNICLATTSKSQETFFAIAKRHNLPDWLVSIRHDFTHSQKIPSIEILNRALDFCFKWLKTNYWDRQSELIKDYVPHKDGEDDLMTILDLYEKVALAGENHYSVSTKLNSKFKKFNIQSNRSKHVLLLRIAKVLITSNSNYDVLSIPDVLGRHGFMFDFLEVSEENYVPEDVIASWLPIILVMSYYNMLLQLLRQFIEICCKNENEDRSKKSAAWLKTICKVGVEENLMIFSSEESFKSTLKEFASWAIAKRNSYTTIYLREILVLADFNEKFIVNIYQAMDALLPKPGSQISTKVYTIDNLKDILDKDEYDSIENEVNSKNNGWQIVKDTYLLNGIPLGNGSSHHSLSS